ncbi:MAG: hypothetical protein JNK58_13010, partial [Phycisphaerae bacterium]|nr:hypothetical protein [Phycisphaerae bacterium]
MRNLKDRSVAEVLMVLACLLGVAAACGPRAEAPAPGGAGEWRSVVNVAAAERFRRAGKGASLTVLPTDLAGSAAPQVGEVV